MKAPRRVEGLDRGALAWYSCDFCGRKGAVYECRYNGRTLQLCPHCILALWGLRGFHCDAPIVRLLWRASQPGKWSEADRVVSELGSRLKAARVEKGRRPSRGSARRR